MTPRLKRLEAEKRRRRQSFQILADLHPGQQRFVGARERSGELASFVALLSARRFGKTEGALRYAAWLCQQRPRVRCVFLYQHRTDACDIAWPLLEDLASRYGWDARPFMIERKYEFGNGSIIKLYGADDPRKHRQFRGQRNDLVVIDEAQDFHSDLEQLVRWLTPGVADRAGRILMCGTPGPLPEGFFHDVVIAKKYPEWQVIRGDPLENPFSRKQLQAQIDKFKLANPAVEREPWFRREYQGEWVTDTRKNVCHVDPKLNYLREWQPHPRDRYILTVDWGDERAGFLVSTYNPEKYPWLVFLEGYELRNARVSKQLQLIEDIRRRYDGVRIVADPGGISKTLVREMTETHGIPFENAEKDERLAQIELMNTDLSLGLIKIHNRADPNNPEKHPLAQQWRRLVWEKNPYNGKREEGKPRDLHDCALYARRYAHKHLYREPQPGPPPVGSAEHWNNEAEKMREQVEQRIQDRQRRTKRRRRAIG